MFGLVLGVLMTAFIIGTFARFAVPGPDPMPAWLTIVIGLVATFIGYGIVIGIEGRHSKDVSWGGIASFFAAVALVVLYRLLRPEAPAMGQGRLPFSRARLRRRATA